MHSKFLSPSSAPSVIKCAFFESGDGSAAADKGTELHRLHEALLLGKPYTVTDGHGITSEDTEGVEWSARTIKELAGNAPILVEQKLMINEEYDIFGRADAVFEDVVCDYKSGRIRPHKEQLMLYCLGLMRSLNLREARYMILYGMFQTLKEWVVTLEAAERLEAELILRRKAPEMFGRKVIDGCTFCKNKNSCMAKLAESVEV